MVMWQPQVKKHSNESEFYLTLSPLLASNHSPRMTAYIFYACSPAWYRRLSAFWKSFCYLCIISQSHVRLAAVRLEMSLSREYHPEAGVWEIYIYKKKPNFDIS